MISRGSQPLQNTTISQALSRLKLKFRSLFHKKKVGTLGGCGLGEDPTAEGGENDGGGQATDQDGGGCDHYQKAKPGPKARRSSYKHFIEHLMGSLSRLAQKERTRCNEG